MKVVGYFVTFGTTPCAFRNVSGSYRAGILVPVSNPAGKDRKGNPAPTAFFSKLRDVRRAVRRSEETAAELQAKQSLIGEWAREHVPSYFLPSDFHIHSLAKQ
jgi:hypothetical protein